MKNLLLASTALMGFAGAAAAEVVIEGSAEMGITGGDDVETQFHNGYNINFVMSGETDTGLSFGATYRLDADASSEENQNPVGDNGTVFLSGAFGKLTLGDTDGALDWAMTETAMGTSITDEGTTHVGYYGNAHGDGRNDDQVLRYEYAFGDFGVALSVEQDDGNFIAASGLDNNGTPLNNTDDFAVAGDSSGDGDPIIGLGAKYATEMSGVALGFGLGYQTGQIRFSDGTQTTGVAGAVGAGVGYQDFDAYGVSAKAAMDAGFSIVLNYSVMDFDVSDDWDHFGIGLGYEMGALLLHANYGKFDFDGATEDQDSFGLIANYDLGGGAILAAGYASDVSTDDGDQDQFSLGMSLSF